MQHSTDTSQPHIHSQQCGHLAIQHEGHIDYLQEGHLYHQQGELYAEHVIAVSATNPASCTPTNCTCDHQASGHQQVPHGDHVDYLCDGQLHHCHDNHCDNHGPVTVH